MERFGDEAAEGSSNHNCIVSNLHNPSPAALLYVEREEAGGHERRHLGATFVQGLQQHDWKRPGERHLQYRADTRQYCHQSGR